MAELPDLEVFAQILSRRFKGKTLKELDAKVAKKLNVSPAELTRALEGKKLDAVSRSGKTLHFHFGEQVLQVHLMLRGELIALEKGAELPKYVILAFHFSGGGLCSGGYAPCCYADAEPGTGQGARCAGNGTGLFCWCIV